MTKTAPKDVAASVRARLFNIARSQGEDFQLVLTRYANERLLFRLASSQHAPSFILKGAALCTLWTGRPHRATRDLDLLGYGNPQCWSVWVSDPSDAGRLDQKSLAPLLEVVGCG